MLIPRSSIGYMNQVFENVSQVNWEEAAALYASLRGAGVIVLNGEGRSKGALNIVCSEIAKMRGGKVVMDRADVGFPDRDMDGAAPILWERYGKLSLLVLSGSGRSLVPLVDAQKLALYITRTGRRREFSVDVVTSDPNSPLGRLGRDFGTCLTVKGREIDEDAVDTSAFKSVGILEDVFILGASLVLQAIAESLYTGRPYEIRERVQRLMNETNGVIEAFVGSDFTKTLVELLERRNLAFFAGLGSGREVGRMIAVRLGHVKRAIGDQVYVAGESSTPPPRAGDVLLVISYSGETEVVISWCRNFKKLGGTVLSIVGRSNTTLESLSDHTFRIETNAEPGAPNDFYIKAAFATSPVPILLVERLQERGLKLPEYILRWYHSITG
ncbi:MAG: SIS domain-containing protein [Thaumarchaeota archaeon]|nr:SIS domain-containing protein [Candidatus Calditenuaceae archaeon]MDW8042873.1 SIS domain-containing protein [Nitrososphaerota archaeon]